MLTHCERMTRRYLTANELRDMLERQQGLCASPNCMSEGPFEADHSLPHAWDDKKPDQLLCVPCHKAKTKTDIKKIAKVKRIAGGRTQYDRRKQSGPKIKGGGFSGWRNFRGEVVRRG